MGSIKKNIILLVSFSIVILYMITTANATSRKCMEELNVDSLGFPVLNGVEHLIFLQDKTIENFTTPHGKTYYTLIIDYGVGDMYQQSFCLWIHKQTVYTGLFGGGRTSQELRKLLEIELYKNTHLCQCLNELSNIGFSINMGNNNEHVNHAVNIPKGNLNTPYSKAYHTLLTAYRVIMYPRKFCPWINLDSDLTEEFQPIDLKTIWIHLVQDLLHETFIGKCQHLHENLCLEHLKLDGCNIDSENVHTEISRMLLAQITRPHSIAYRKLSLDFQVTLSLRNFCLWSYKNKDDVNDEGIWNGLKRETIFAICIDQLRFDEFYESWTDNKLRFQNGNINYPRTSHGEEYFNLLILTDPTMVGPDVTVFCKRRAFSYMLSLNNPE